MKFPRVEGARMHGIKKALGIPVHHTTFGKVIVAMYSTKDIVKDLTLVQKCYSRLQGAQGIDQTVSCLIFVHRVCSKFRYVVLTLFSPK